MLLCSYTLFQPETLQTISHRAVYFIHEIGAGCYQRLRKNCLYQTFEMFRCYEYVSVGWLQSNYCRTEHNATKAENNMKLKHFILKKRLSVTSRHFSIQGVHLILNKLMNWYFPLSELKIIRTTNCLIEDFFEFNNSSDFFCRLYTWNREIWESFICCSILLIFI